MTWRRLPLGFAGALAGALGCTTPALDLAQLSGRPVAFVYRTEDEATQRAEQIERARGEQLPPPPGRARAEDVGAYLGLRPDQEKLRADLLGRLVFLDARSESIEPQAFAVRGARPLDWSADGRRLLFASPREGALQVLEYDRESGNLRELTHGPAWHPSACYGPEGRIAATELRATAQGAVARIVVSEPQGSAWRPVSPGPADSSPAWSPDGERLLYVLAAESEGARIAALDWKTGEAKLIARGRQPSFTPDGQWVVYSAKTSQGWRLRRMRPDGSGKLPLGTSPHDEHAPSVSPDGRYVAYVAAEGTRQQLRVRALDGRGDRPLLGRGDGAEPVWN